MTPHPSQIDPALCTAATCMSLMLTMHVQIAYSASASTLDLTGLNLDLACPESVHITWMAEGAPPASCVAAA